MFLLGIWKTYDELEETLSLPELFVTLDAAREKEHRDRRFLAALKGINLDDTSKTDTSDDLTQASEYGLGFTPAVEEGSEN